MRTPEREALEELARGVELLCLDAGNTVVFLDHARLAELLLEATGVRGVPPERARAWPRG